MCNHLSLSQIPSVFFISPSFQWRPPIALPSFRSQIIFLRSHHLTLLSATPRTSMRVASMQAYICRECRNDLIEVLRKKHASGTSKTQVFYFEACESGSIFEGLLPEGLNIYATTASNTDESSWELIAVGSIQVQPPELKQG